VDRHLGDVWLHADPGRLIRTAQSLSPSRAVRSVAEELLARVAAADEPHAIVSALPPIDLLAAIREADDEQRVELLSLMSAEQYVGVVDLACWRAGAFDRGALAALISPALDSGRDAAVRLFQSLEGELRTLLLKPHVVVHLREEKDDDFEVEEGSELFECVDGRYAVELPRPDEVPREIRQILAALLDRPFEEYMPELECLRWDLPSDLEESAARWRAGRLADFGYATREEGVAALAPKSPEALRGRIEKGEVSPRACDEAALPALYGRCLGGAALLDAALERATRFAERDPTGRAALLPAELGAAVNLFLCGARFELSDLEEAARGIRLARDLLALGLGAVSRGDVDFAARALLGAAPIAFIQAGMGVLVPLRERARSLARKLGAATGGSPYAALDPPHAVAVELLAMEIPRRFPPLDEGADLSPAPIAPLAAELVGFADPAEAARGEALLAEAEHVPDLLARLGALGQRPVPLPSAALAAALPVEGGADEEELYSRAMRALAGPLGFEEAGETHPAAEPEPRRRLVLRLLHIGRARDLPQSTR
jgi:hypothetical protein